MSKNDFDGAFALLETVKFGGIESSATFGKGGDCSYMRNFRVLADGSLEKRCGFSLVAELGGDIRGIWSGTIDDIDTVIAVVGRQVFRILEGSGGAIVVGQILSDEGDVEFFRMDGGLYIIDGVEFYLCGRDSISVVGEGYIPLYAKEWGRYGGVMNEPMNHFSRRVRMNYVLDSDSTISVESGLTLVRVEKAILNGVDVTSSASVDSVTKIKPGKVMQKGDVLDVLVEVDGSYFEKNEILSCRHAAVYGGRYDNGVYCFGGNDGSRVFRSKYVGTAALNESRKWVSGCNGLYFPLDYDFKVDDGHSDVSAVCRHYDRLLLFGYNDTRVNDLSDIGARDIPVMPVNGGVGCRGVRAVALCENDPVTVSRDGIYRWTSNTDERDESNARLISTPIEKLLTKEFLDGAVIFNNRSQKEIWVGNPTDPYGLVFIYNYLLDIWYSFDGISAENFFLFDGKVGFYRGGLVYLFSPECYSDAGLEIVGEFVSRYSDMERSASHKRMQRCLAVGSGVGNFTVEFYNDEKRRVESIDFVGRSGRGADRQERIIRTGRFSYIQYRIIARGAKRQRIYGITLIAGK